MERKNTNLFFLSGIVLLFMLLLIGRSTKHSSNDSSVHRNTPASIPHTPLTESSETSRWVKNVRLDQVESSEK